MSFTAIYTQLLYFLYREQSVLVYSFAGSGQAVGEPTGDIISGINIGSESIMDSKSVVDVF